MASRQRVLKWGIPLNDHVARVPFNGMILPTAETILGSDIPHVAIWTVEPVGKPRRMRTLRVFGTGAVIPEGWEWRASAPRVAGVVFHVFEKVTGLENN